MSKEQLRFQKLDFSEEDLLNCRNNYMSLRMLKKIKEHSQISLFLAYLLSFVFLGFLIYTLFHQDLFEEQIDGGIYLYYILASCSTACVLFFTRGIFSYHKKLYGADSEKIQSIDVCFREISSGTRTGAYAPYLKAADLEFTGITILKSPLELFDQEEVYRFYFSSQSKVLLAVEETQS